VKQKKAAPITRIEVPVLFTKEEHLFLVHLGRRNNLTPSQMMASVMRRHLKSRYKIPRREWYYVFGK
jgi:hypothetical protein